MINQLKKRRQWTNAPTLLAMSMVMQIRRYNVERIAQYGRSRATLDATGCRNQASICPVLSWRTPTRHECDITPKFCLTVQFLRTRTTQEPNFNHLWATHHFLPSRNSTHNESSKSCAKRSKSLWVQENGFMKTPSNSICTGKRQRTRYGFFLQG